MGNHHEDDGNAFADGYDGISFHDFLLLCF